MARLLALWAPPPRVKVSEWAERYRVLTSQASAVYGPWRNDTAPYLTEMMDCVCNPNVHEVAIMAASQVGKSEVALNVIGWTIATRPAPIMVVLPSVEMGEGWSKDRLAPMIRESPDLRDRVHEAKSRFSHNTILYKSFPGGQITIAGANSAASLCSRPIQLLVFEEVDRAPANVDGEGDPVNLARKRTSTFVTDKKVVLISSPRVKGVSRIEKAYENSDQRKYHVPCPHCGSSQALEFSGLRWERGDPGDAHYQCLHCSKEIRDGHKREMLAAGRWVPSKKHSRVGFHISALYSPWVQFSEIAAEYEEAGDNQELLKVFFNTYLGLPYEMTADAIPTHELVARREEYAAEVPQGVLVLTMGVDVQADRLEYEVVGWSETESWSVAVGRIFGDPSTPLPWNELDALMAKPWHHEGKVDLKIAATGVDSGGHWTQVVYGYCRERASKRVFALKGVGGPGRPLVGSPYGRRSGRDRRKVELYPVGTDEAKDTLYAQLRVSRGSYGYCHFPLRPEYSDAWFEQLTAEVMVQAESGGLRSHSWVLPSGKRNEALDARVYAMAALAILRPVWEAIESRLQEKIEHQKTLETPQQQQSEAHHAQEQRTVTRPPERRLRRRSALAEWNR